MPLYEYECTSCRNRFEVRQRMTEDPITVCPTCGGTTKRVLFPAGIIFKGSGWYITDSRKSDAASTTSSTSETTKSETKSEAKKETPSTSPSTSSGSSSDTGSKSTASTTTT